MIFSVLSVVAAAVASFAIGSFWYKALSGAWIRASNVPVDEKGMPQNATNPFLYVCTFVLQLIVAWMMRHMFVTAGIDGLFTGMTAGAGVGLFIITPWLALTNAFAGRPILLSAIDGGYATLGAAAMGAVLGLF